MTCFLHLGFEDGSDHRYTTTTSGSRFGLRFDLAQLSHTIFDTPGNGAFGNILPVSLIPILRLYRPTWQEQMVASSSRSAPSSSSDFLAPKINSEGGTVNFFYQIRINHNSIQAVGLTFDLVIATNLVKDPTSPIIIPPRILVPSLVKMYFLYVAEKGS